jgi:hypothetical protein
MKDMVSMRKMRPLPTAEFGGAALSCGGDFFLAGNWASLAAREFFTTEDTEPHRGKQLF